MKKKVYRERYYGTQEEPVFDINKGFEVTIDDVEIVKEEKPVKKTRKTRKKKSDK